MKSAKEKIKHWKAQQDLRYNFFLILKSRELSLKKKATKIYVDMARFVCTKNPTQCRTHHEKKISELRKVIMDVEKENIRRFYREAYVIRKLGEDHLRKELAAFLLELKAKGIITSKEHDTLQGDIDGNLTDLNLELTYSNAATSGESESSSQAVQVGKVVRREIEVIGFDYSVEENNFYFSGSEEY